MDTQPLEPQETTPTPPAQPVQPTPPPAGGLAITGMIVGIVALFAGWVPVLGLVIAIAGIIISILALRKHQSKPMAITGIVAGAIGLIWSLIVSFILIITIASGVNYFSSDAYQKTQTESSQETKEDTTASESLVGDGLEIRVNEASFNNTSDGSGEANATYTVVNATVKNVSDKEINFSTFFFILTVDGETIFTEDEVEVTPALTNTTLAVGESVTGNLVFKEKTQNPGNVVLEYVLSTRDANGEPESLAFEL